MQSLFQNLDFYERLKSDLSAMSEAQRLEMAQNAFTQIKAASGTILPPGLAPIIFIDGAQFTALGLKSISRERLELLRALAGDTPIGNGTSFDALPDSMWVQLLTNPIDDMAYKVMLLMLHSLGAEQEVSAIVAFAVLTLWLTMAYADGGNAAGEQLIDRFWVDLLNAFRYAEMGGDGKKYIESVSLADLRN